LTFPYPGELPDLGIEPTSPALFVLHVPGLTSEALSIQIITFLPSSLPISTQDTSDGSVGIPSVH